MEFNPKTDYVVTANGVCINTIYYMKEITLFSKHIRSHFRIRIPSSVLKAELTEKDRKTLTYCENYILGQKLTNKPFDTQLFTVTSEIKRLQCESPSTTFWIKGDLKLKHYLTNTCHVSCENLPLTLKVASPSFGSQPYLFCPDHDRSQCCFHKANFYFKSMARS